MSAVDPVQLLYYFFSSETTDEQLIFNKGVSTSGGIGRGAGVGSYISNIGGDVVSSGNYMLSIDYISDLPGMQVIIFKVTAASFI